MEVSFCVDVMAATSNNSVVITYFLCMMQKQQKMTKFKWYLWSMALAMMMSAGHFRGFLQWLSCISV
jgi:hypothetical protein